jgi:hypothetical protein
MSQRAGYRWRTIGGEDLFMSDFTYAKLIKRFEAWKSDGLLVDWSHPTGSLGDHLCWLFDVANISDLMNSSSGASKKMEPLLGSNGYFVYKTMLAQKTNPQM